MSTTTGKKRTNRPDVRPNEKLRRKISREIEDDKTIQELRVTKKQKSERKERLVPVQPMKKNPKEVGDKVVSFFFIHLFTMSNKTNTYVCIGYESISKEIETN